MHCLCGGGIFEHALLALNVPNFGANIERILTLPLELDAYVDTAHLASIGSVLCCLSKEALPKSRISELWCWSSLQ